MCKIVFEIGKIKSLCSWFSSGPFFFSFSTVYKKCFNLSSIFTSLIFRKGPWHDAHCCKFVTLSLWVQVMEICSAAHRCYLDASLPVGGGNIERFPHGQGGSKKLPHQIILALDLTALKFNGILTVDFLEIQSNSKWKFTVIKIGPDARSWDEKTIKGAALIKGGRSWAPVPVVDWICSCS